MISKYPQAEGDDTRYKIEGWDIGEDDIEEEEYALNTVNGEGYDDEIGIL